MNDKPLTSNKTPPVVAMAILYREGKFLMQLRDDIPGILYPGLWGLFGGHLESDETPETGLVREVGEEINYLVPQPKKFRCYADNRAIRYIFHSPLTVEVDDLEQMEGSDLGLVSPKECDSFRSKLVYPIQGESLEVSPLNTSVNLARLQNLDNLISM